eukprot:scaffold5064_cov121-Cylindrotheca_fusiformis.AAC.20
MSLSDTTCDKDAVGSEECMLERPPENTTGRKQVSFDMIEIREYSRCLGDHPDAIKGPPLSIDWQYEEAGSFVLEEYESSRPARRSHTEFMLPAAARSRILKQQANVTHKEIVERIAEIRHVKHQRQMSIAAQEYEHLIVVYQSVKRKLKRFAARLFKQKNTTTDGQEDAERTGKMDDSKRSANATPTDVDCSSR